jgi:hypothetical protein
MGDLVGAIEPQVRIVHPGQFGLLLGDVRSAVGGLEGEVDRREGRSIPDRRPTDAGVGRLFIGGPVADDVFAEHPEQAGAEVVPRSGAGLEDVLEPHRGGCGQ